MTHSNPFITLLTDFGLSDHFVAAMKGVMLSINQDLRFTDISHLVPPQDIFGAAFTLNQACFYFPPGTIHLAVVDPGVGTERKAMAVSAGGHFFVAPDNGLLTYVLESQEDCAAYEIAADEYFRKPLSGTFHGRDIFAPVAAWISRGIPLHEFGPLLPNPIRLDIPPLEKIQDDQIRGCILSVDHFGNLITNLKPGDVSRSAKIRAGRKEVTVFRKTYGEGKKGEIFVVPGSTGYLEIVVREGSAASLLNLKSGDSITVIDPTSQVSSPKSQVKKTMI
jgi:S-adenosylmethionine hydrolase